MIAEPGNVPIGVTLDSGLSFVAMKVNDVTAGHPGSFVGTFPMTEGFAGSYSGDFPGVASHNYTVKKAVFTDGLYTTIDTNYPTGDDVVQVKPATAVAITTKPVLGFEMSISANRTNMEIKSTKFDMEIESPEEII